MLTDVARDNGNQIVAASHSEVLLNEAADRDVVVAFTGMLPHRINDRGSQVLKSLREIGFEHYYQAEQTGWVLYLEGSTDLAILRALAHRLGHDDARRALERPFVHYVGDLPGEARKHFWGVQEAFRGLKGIALFDRIDAGLPENMGAVGLMWERREIESYLCYRETLEAYADQTAERETPGPLFAAAEKGRRRAAMQGSIEEVEQALLVLRRGSPWDHNTKVSDDFLTPLFEKYFAKLALPNVMAKKNYHELAYFVPLDLIDNEVQEKLDAIVRVACSAEGADERQ